MRFKVRPFRITSQFAVLGAGATVMALGIVVPVLATTETGPLTVTVTASPNLFALKGSTTVAGSVGVDGVASAANSDGVYGYAASTGDGVAGLSPAGNGVVGTTTANTSSSFAGVAGYDNGSPTNKNYGVSGESQNGTGVYGVTMATATAGPDGKAGGGQSGVIGADDTVGGDQGINVGVTGTTVGGAFGVQGTSSTDALGGVGGSGTTGYGVYGDSTGNAGVYGINTTAGSTPAPNIDTDNGVYGTSTQGVGIYGYSKNRNAIVAENNNPTYNALYAQADNATGTAFRAYNSSTKANMAFDYHGNLTVTGNVIANGTTLSARVRSNSDLMTYAAQSTESTVEDVGSAQLVNGTAAVPLAGDFRQTIDGSSTYMVFLTPYGDNRGLYIAERGPAGFVVRESGGGRSTLAFDYRIVARPYGAREARLPHYAAMVRPSVDQGTRTSEAPYESSKVVALRANLATLDQRRPPAVRPQPRH